jgi:hypothetical protein
VLCCYHYTAALPRLSRAMARGKVELWMPRGPRGAFSRAMAPLATDLKSAGEPSKPHRLGRTCTRATFLPTEGRNKDLTDSATEAFKWKRIRGNARRTLPCWRRRARSTDANPWCSTAHERDGHIIWKRLRMSGHLARADLSGWCR